MTNVGLTGEPRHGKSAKLVDLTYKAVQCHYGVISAMDSLNKQRIPYVLFDINKVLDAFERKISIQKAFGFEEGKHIFMNLDEITTLGGYNRLFASQQNIVMTFLFMQAGKRRISAGWTAQMWDTADKNIKPLTGLNIECRRVGERWDPKFFVLKYRFLNSRRPAFYKIWKPEEFRPIFKLYDTEEPMYPQLIKKSRS